MDFKKYTSIENHYQKKYVEYQLEKYSELKECFYILTEKIDGANIQLLFEPNKPLQVGTRNKWLAASENFFDIWNTLNKYQGFIDKVQDICKHENGSIRLYGELFGKGIQKRVYYGEDKYIRFFDAELDGSRITYMNFLSLMVGIFQAYHLMVPQIAMVKSLQEALEYSPEFKSTIFPDFEGDNAAEGFVIKPFDDTHLILKVKGEKFKEREKKPRREKPPKNQEVTLLNTLFKGYINENRIKSVFSKNGEIRDPMQLGDYIKWTLEDAKEDFLKDCGKDLERLEAKDQKQVFNVGSLIVNLLKGYL